MSATASNTVLVIDVEAARSLISALRDQGFEVLTARDDEHALHTLDEAPIACLVTPLTGPRLDGMKLLRHARARDPEAIVIVLADESAAVERVAGAVREGAYDVLPLPAHAGRVLALVERGFAHRRLAARVAEMEMDLDGRLRLGGLDGRSRAVARVLDQIRTAGASRAPVLIEGASCVSTAGRCRPTSWSAICSARRRTAGVRAPVAPSWRTAERCSSRRSARRRRASSCGSCGCSRTARASGLAARSRGASPSAWCARRPATSPAKSRPDGCAPICSSGSRWCGSRCRRCAIGARMFRSWSRLRSAPSTANTDAASPASRAARSSAWSSTDGPATCASCGPRSRAWWWRPAAAAGSICPICRPPCATRVRAARICASRSA